MNINSFYIICLNMLRTLLLGYAFYSFIINYFTCSNVGYLIKHVLVHSFQFTNMISLHTSLLQNLVNMHACQ